MLVNAVDNSILIDKRNKRLSIDKFNTLPNNNFEFLSSIISRANIFISTYLNKLNTGGCSLMAERSAVEKFCGIFQNPGEKGPIPFFRPEH